MRSLMNLLVLMVEAPRLTAHGPEDSLAHPSA
jgi:hypothetical protein